MYNSIPLKSVPDKCGVLSQKPDIVSYMIQQIKNKFANNDFVGAGEIDLLEFLIPCIENLSGTLKKPNYSNFKLGGGGGVKGKFLLLDYWSILQFLDEYIQHEVLTLYCTVHDQYSLHSI